MIENIPEGTPRLNVVGGYLKDGGSVKSAVVLILYQSRETPLLGVESKGSGPELYSHRNSVEWKNHNLVEINLLGEIPAKKYRISVGRGVTPIMVRLMEVVWRHVSGGGEQSVVLDKVGDHRRCGVHGRD